MSRRFARRIERYCCLGVKYFPLAFVYSITTWAVWVESTIGFLPSQSRWIGSGSSYLGILLYILLNWSYTTAVFTSPGTTTSTSNGYSALPTNAPTSVTNFTVKANGELRYCKKCEARKPDRAHHCSTCRTCVLKMDHHCPWLATCVGLRNYKPFLLFLIYTTLFCFVCFAVSVGWVWQEILNDGQYSESLMPINYVMLTVISGIIGLVLAGFTGWHILLASRGQTTIECLEKTRYLSPLRKAARSQHIPRFRGDEEDRGQEYGHPLQNLNTDEPRSIARSQNGDLRHGESRQFLNYDEQERYLARKRYDEYLDEQDSEKLPSAFDLGWRRNLYNLFGPKRALWALPICNSIGDGWAWEPSPKWLEARAKITKEREEQRLREQAAGWGEPLSPRLPSPHGAGRHYVTSYPNGGRSMSKADKILGRDPSLYADGLEVRQSSAISLSTLRPGNDDLDDDDYDISSGEEGAEQHIPERKASPGWPKTFGIASNTLLGNALSRKKSDLRGADGNDDDVD
ncbi:DHHC palmitoyltransferase-domain-containing protein [Xylogone sp. PMI_703]|nr:DHHC palmitoyltransferase-domain-containing protein [Xylogone sp. PMI_703]